MQIRLEQLFHVYQSKLTGHHQALTDISLSLSSGEITALAGPSGSGKTTLIQHLNGILKPTSGRVLLDDQNLADDGTDLNLLRKRVGLVFQFPEIQLFEETVFRDVAFGPKNLGQNESVIADTVERSLSRVGLDFQQFKDKSPFELSGGEKRRVAIAGILAMNPEFLVLDEPTVGLDRKSARGLESVILEYHRQGRGVLFVSHDMNLAARLASRILVLVEGRLVFDGPPVQLFQNADLMKRACLLPPHIMQFLTECRARGLDVSTDCLTLDDAKNALKIAVQNRKDLS